MYRTTIEEAVEAVKTATREASKTKESMIKFLFDAGIIKEKEYKQKLKIFAKQIIIQILLWVIIVVIKKLV
jgi:hypothetical protein